MYSIVLLIHSWFRWLTLIAAVGAVVNAYRPLVDRQLAGRAWDKFCMITLDIQVFLGLWLYLGLSPFTVDSLNNMSQTMKTPALRFFAIEHIFGMVVAMVLIRAGRVTSANAKTPESARKKRLVLFTLGLLAMLATIPWPGLVYGRPLFRVE
jgi:hypothetical protein